MNFKSNFSFLEDHDSQLADTIKWAEVYLPENPNICVVTIGQFCELLVKKIADYGGVNLIRNEKQYHLVIRLKEAGLFNDNICDKFQEIRKNRNDAYYGLSANYESALTDLKNAYQLTIWYYKKFVNPYFIHTTPFVVPSKSIFTTAQEIFSHYTNILKQLENSLNQLNELRIKERNFAIDREQIKKQKESLKMKIVNKKRQAKNRYNQVLEQQSSKSNNLHKQISEIDLHLMKIEIEINDLQGFECNSEVSNLLKQIEQRKQTLKTKKNQLEYSLSQMKNHNLSSPYSASERREIELLLEELDNLIPNQNKYEKEIKEEIEKKEEEAKSIWLKVNFLQKLACQQKIDLPIISYDILRAIDDHNVRLN